MASLCLLLVAGCSRTELVYNNADWLLQRWTTGLVDANAAQREDWRALFRDAMARHRRELLPDLVTSLTLLQASAEHGALAGEVSCWLAAVDRAYRTHAAWAVDTAGRVLADVSPAQVDHLAAELVQRNEEYRETYLHEDPRRRERARVERYTERIERWTGDLSTEQLRLVEQAVRAIPDVAGDWLAYRRQQQQGLLALLRESADGPAVRRFLTAWWVDLADRPAALVAGTAQLRRGMLDLVVVLDATLTEDQRATLVDNIGALRDDLASAAGAEQPLQVARVGLAGCGDLLAGVN